jgi:hypothetical protein
MRRAVARIPKALLLSFCWWDRYDDCRAIMEVAGLVEPPRRLAKRWQKPRAQAGARRKKALPPRKARRKRGQRKHPETPWQIKQRTLKGLRTKRLKRAGAQ